MVDSTRTPPFATPVFLVPAPGAISKNVTTEAGTLVKTGEGTLYSISVNAAQADGTAEVIDGVDGTGTVLGTVQLKSQGPISLGWNFAVGLFVITQGTGTVDVTVNYQ